MSHLAQLIALAILLNAAPTLSQCSAIATSTAATNVGAYVQGSNTALSYAFKGQTAPANGLFCNGCAKYEYGATAGTAGTSYVSTDVDAGDETVFAGTGFFCPSSGTACSAAAAPFVAPSAGKVFYPESVASGTTFRATGVLCPATAQGTSPSNTCAAANTGAAATYLGTACVGSTGACTAVINGYTSPSNGVYCQGCVYKNSGETANAAGNWWTSSDVASGGTAASAGIFCPSAGGACTSITAGTTASSAGKFYSSSVVAVGATATSAGVLCPTTGGAVSTGGSSTGAIVTATQGSALGWAEASAPNSAFKSATSPLFAVIAALFFMMVLK